MRLATLENPPTAPEEATAAPPAPSEELSFRPVLFEDEGMIGPIFTNPLDFEFD